MDHAYLGEATDVVLGQEFLTWLWYRSESQAGRFKTDAGEPFALFMEQRVSVTGGEGDAKETTSVSGLLSELREAKTGLAMGKKVSKALVRIEADAEQWSATLKAEDMSLSSFKTPKVDTGREEGEDPDAAFLEKMYLLERGLAFLDSVFLEFLALRFSPGWKEEAAAAGRWMAQDA
ncbi:hypothetical protein [Desulfocurvus sp.]|jgi:hypothetical protein|uniref:hypothetical protein n=1 Tax=Desulfocurvus sp. TaxID=2871698 RepID=UPI0025C73A3B|nr:hypothetical protein [Desulfocurvus sp.]MCK9240498.1 hypothetical protein [Desulfocurvus sp.]